MLILAVLVLGQESWCRRAMVPLLLRVTGGGVLHITLKQLSCCSQQLLDTKSSVIKCQTPPPAPPGLTTPHKPLSSLSSFPCQLPSPPGVSCTLCICWLGGGGWGRWSALASCWPMAGVWGKPGLLYLGRTAHKKQLPPDTCPVRAQKQYQAEEE